MCARFCIAASFVVSMAVAAEYAFAADATAAGSQPDYQRLVDRGVAYLVENQADDGSYSASSGPAVTALCATALMRSGLSPDDPTVAKSLKYVEGFVQPDGGIYAPNSNHRNYETSVALLCFTAVNPSELRDVGGAVELYSKDGRYTKLIQAARTFLKQMQWDPGEGVDVSNVNYGGAGYGGRNNRPDLSNTSFFLDALQAAGDGPSDEAVQRALVFVSRCQNLATQYNTTEFADKNPDGGFYYTPAAGGLSMAGKTEETGLRSYGSMTYAGLKSMIFAGVTADDPRVKAAVQWIRKHYDLTSNPGMGQAGLYYGYHTFAKALHALGENKFADAQGASHDWRAELIAELAKRQREDGSWINSEKRWMEGDPNLVTAYVLLTLSYCKPQAGN